ncbi:MAG: sigma-70 family RNA polymerase sigma factor [Clostridia bacterium]|nr:sigma-70 family RNA polymerase sigma factor [Clostridia bacterium]
MNLWYNQDSISFTYLYFRAEGNSVAEDLPILLEKIRCGDELAFNLLCSTYQNLTEKAANRFLPSFRGVEGGELYGRDDLLQYARIALYRAACTYRPDDEGKNVSFGLYAKICINNALISQLRKFKSECRRMQAVRRQKRTEKRSADPLQQLAASEGAEELLAKIAEALSGYEKEIFDYYIDGKSVGEIAERLGRDEKSVSNALYRMKVKVRGLLKNQSSIL